MLVGLECILRLTPDVYCDTMGAAFTYPVVHYLCNAKVVAYVHYPIISTVRMVYRHYFLLSETIVLLFFPLLCYMKYVRGSVFMYLSPISIPVVCQ